MSYKDIQDKVFKSKEAEKYNFTDDLKDMSDEARAVDTILKHNKMGPLYSKGLSKSVKMYDPDNYDYEKIEADKVRKIQNNLKKNGVLGVDDMDINDVLEAGIEARDIDMDNAMVDIQEWDLNGEDDIDPWGERDRDYD